MASRTPEIGQKVLHPTKSDWGVGEILSIQGSTLRVRFEHAGLKQINTSFITLLAADGRATNQLGWELDQPKAIDIPTLRGLCDQFRHEMSTSEFAQLGNSLALAVISDIRQYGFLQKGTARLLIQHCEPSPSVNTRSAELAQQISNLIYGKVFSVSDLGQ